MATSLLRLGRLGSLKCLLRESWGTQRTPFVAALCTKADAPPKTQKKAKAATKEADERASLLAYKPAVAFPSKLSATGFLPKDVALGESTDSPVADTAEAKVVVEDEITKVQPADNISTTSEGYKASEIKVEAQEDTSSSSSSDSESDSDSDDEKPKTETVVKSEEKTAEEVLTSKQVDVAVGKVKSESVIAPTASFEELRKDAQAKVKPEGVPTTSTKAVGSEETLMDPAPVISSSMTEAIPEVTGESTDVVSPEEMVDTAAKVKTAPTENIVENESETKDKSAPKEEQQPANVKTSSAVISEVTIEGSPQEVANTVECSPGVAAMAPGDDVSVQEVVAKPEYDAALGTVAKDVDATGIEMTSSEDLKDPAPVAVDAVESLAETEVVEAPEEQVLDKAPEPEPEPFDNTTYKNLQHHQYNMYTFVDMDVEMAKHRLPQPSSGRPSPRH